MAIAITDDHVALATTARDLLATHKARDAARALLEAPREELPPFWPELARVGWLGLHLPEAHGGSGYGVPELAVVVEEFGRAVAPGPFVPTVIASAVIAARGDEALQAAYLPGLADGSVIAAIALDGGALGGGLADLVLVLDGDDAVVLDAHAKGVTLTVPNNVDPTRRIARLERAKGAKPVAVLTGAAGLARAIARTLLAAEAVGVARECVDAAVEYAKVREQFGRPIATFQAVKHHCANMLVAAELATAAVWDAARAATSGGDQFELAAATAAALAVPAAHDNAQLNIQVHGGIGFTWEHDAHLLLRRAIAISAAVDAAGAARDVTAAAIAGVRREVALELPAEAEAIRAEVGDVVRQLAALDKGKQRRLLIDTGYAMPHWPEPWGREAGAVEQLVIDEEFAAAGIVRPRYGITGWVILTLIQHGNADQIERWVRPALEGETVWCQLFSEPDAGSDAAGVKTRGTRVDGGWIVNGQKVWTSAAQYCHRGLATVRTNPDAPKHAGITTMVIDMHAPGVEVRPLRQVTGGSDFNEVFFSDVFVPDDDVVGAPDAGWTVARATLGNERVSIGGGAGGATIGGLLAKQFATDGARVVGGAVRVGRFLATEQAMKLLNLRRAQRAVSGAEPGPEGNVTKLVLAELGHEQAAIAAELAGSEIAFLDGHGATAAMLVLANRAMSIAGGTSEITRNQIGERILGLPRDPLIK